VSEVPSASGLSWGLLARFADYVRGSGGEIAASGGAIVDETGMPSWPLVDAEGDGGDVGVLRFAGTVRYFAHFGALDVPVADPVLRIGGGRADLLISHPTTPDSLLPLAALAWRELPAPAQARAWLGDEVKLRDEAVHLFGGSYPAGMLLDPLVVLLDISQ
jgi:hypothetical protein